MLAFPINPQEMSGIADIFEQSKKKIYQKKIISNDIKFPPSNKYFQS